MNENQTSQPRQTVFYTSLNTLLRKYFIANGPQPSRAEFNTLPNLMLDQKKSLFEQFLLFDAISFKVYGENLLIPMMRGFFGKKGFDALIEQGAIRFVLWTPMITYFVTEIKGVSALQSGNTTSPVHCDPEQSIELGLKRAVEKPSRLEIQRMLAKLLPTYSLPPSDLAAQAVGLANSAFGSGKLREYGLNPDQSDLMNLPIERRKVLAKCAEELLEFKYLAENNMTSFSSYGFYSIFDSSISKIISATNKTDAFNAIGTLEGIPDLKEIYQYIDSPLSKIAKIRARSSSEKFRRWLCTAQTNESAAEVTKYYLDSISEAKGFFQTTGGKITKNIAMTAVGTAVGASIGHYFETTTLGVLGGIAVPKLLEPIADSGLDLVDQFLLEKLTKGWTPRMFFNDLAKLKGTSVKSQ
jgi:hypothetical protein